MKQGKIPNGSFSKLIFDIITLLLKTLLLYYSRLYYSITQELGHISLAYTIDL